MLETINSPGVGVPYMNGIHYLLVISLLLYEPYMQMCLQDLTKISPSIRNSTPIIAFICLRLDIASPKHLDRSLFAFILCFFTEKCV